LAALANCPEVSAQRIDEVVAESLSKLESVAESPLKLESVAELLSKLESVAE
jgi:hypothetical protein